MKSGQEKTVINYVTTTDKTMPYVKDRGTGSPGILLHGWPLSADGRDDLRCRLPRTAIVPLPMTAAVSAVHHSRGVGTTTTRSLYATAAVRGLVSRPVLAPELLIDADPGRAMDQR